MGSSSDKNKVECPSVGIVACACSFDLGFWGCGAKCDLSAHFLHLPFYDLALDVDSHDHVIAWAWPLMREYC